MDTVVVLVPASALITSDGRPVLQTIASVGASLADLALSGHGVVVLFDTARPENSGSAKLSSVASAEWRATLATGLAIVMIDLVERSGPECRLLSDSWKSLGDQQSLANVSVADVALPGSITFTVPRFGEQLYEPGLEAITLTRTLRAKLVVCATMPASSPRDIRYRDTAALADALALSHGLFSAARQYQVPVHFVGLVELDGVAEADLLEKSIARWVID